MKRKYKAVLTLSAAIFQIVYVLLKFERFIIFFLENPPRKLEILNFFYYLFQCGFSNVTIAHAQL